MGSELGEGPGGVGRGGGGGRLGGGGVGGWKIVLGRGRDSGELKGWNKCCRTSGLRKCPGIKTGE